jgi:long-subunit acyl-CoA synthetase (AMP-forming)
MKNQGNSMQSQNPAAQAQQSLDHVHNAVAMAESHPESQMIEQANHSVAKAAKSIDQIDASTQADAKQLAKDELKEETNRLNRL